MTVLNGDGNAVPEQLEKSLYAFSAHIRNPDSSPAPADIDDRRMEIYRDLFYRNIEGFISSAFPVLRSISSDEYWQSLVRDFMVQHRAKTPYFLEIAQEFLVYLERFRGELNCPEDFPFMLELAHYEWIELALDVSEAEIPLAAAQYSVDDLLQQKLQVSPLVWCLSYVYPVHRIGLEYLSEHSLVSPPSQQTHLIVYRNWADEVGFIEANTVTLRLVQLIQQNPELTLLKHLEAIAEQLQQAVDEAFLNNAKKLLLQLKNLSVLIEMD